MKRMRCGRFVPLRMLVPHRWLVGIEALVCAILHFPCHPVRRHGSRRRAGDVEQEPAIRGPMRKNPALHRALRADVQRARSEPQVQAGQLARQRAGCQLPAPCRPEAIMDCAPVLPDPAARAGTPRSSRDAGHSGHGESPGGAAGRPYWCAGRWGDRGAGSISEPPFHWRTP